MTLHVDSEVGRLRQVILHRPGLELSRLTPDNINSLLFDDILWAKRAREEHDAFAQVLRDRGVHVHYFADLLTEVLDIPQARSWAARSPTTRSGRASSGRSAGWPSRRAASDWRNCSSAAYSSGSWPGSP